MSSHKWLLPASVSPGWVPIASCFSGISKWVWPRLLSNYCFCPGSRKVWDFCARPLRVESLSHSLLALPKGSPTGLQSQMSWGLIFPVQNPWAGKSNVGLGLLTPWGEPLQLWLSSSLWVTYGGGDSGQLVLISLRGHIRLGLRDGGGILRTGIQQPLSGARIIAEVLLAETRSKQEGASPFAPPAFSCPSAPPVGRACKIKAWFAGSLTLHSWE